MYLRNALLAGSLCPLLACGAGADRDDNAAEIVGGHSITIAEAPWQVSVQSSAFGGHFCGGTIVSADWVVTAQHCAEAVSTMQVLAGVDTLSLASSGQLRDVDQVILYPDYVTPTQGKDIALLHLAEPLDLDGTTARAIGMVDASAALAGLTDPGVDSMVTGWGSLSSGGGSPDVLQAVEVPLISNADAQAGYPEEIITDDQIAAGLLEGGLDACQGDSGGPLVVPDASGDDVVLAGVVSWGYGCAAPNRPGMYARVSYFHDWSLSEMGVVTPPVGGLIVNEILADPPAGADVNGDGTANTRQDEFVELVNGGDQALNLSGASIADGYSVRGTLPAGTVLEPGAALLVFGGGAPTGLPVPALAFNLGLNNGGDTVTVTAADGTVLAQASYGAEGGQNQSLVRLTEGEDSEWVQHLEVSSETSSPGTRADGTPL